MSFCSLLRSVADCLDNPKIRIVPSLGLIKEQSAIVVPKHYCKCRSHRGIKLMAFTLTDSQMVSLSVSFVNKKGNPAPVDGPPEWMVDNPNVLALTPSADGMSCVVASVGPLGNAKVTVHADADMGSGIVDITGFLDVAVVAGAASTVVIVPGVPSEQP